MGRGNTSWEKRQREKQKRERKEMKRARRDERREADGTTEEVGEGPSQDELMARFAEVGRKHAAGQITDAVFEDERKTIFEQLGLATD